MWKMCYHWFGLLFLMVINLRILDFVGKSGKSTYKDDHLPCTMCTHTYTHIPTADWLILWWTTTTPSYVMCCVLFHYFLSSYFSIPFWNVFEFWPWARIIYDYVNCSHICLNISAFQRIPSTGFLSSSGVQTHQLPLLIIFFFLCFLFASHDTSSYENTPLKIFCPANGFKIHEILSNNDDNNKRCSYLI